MNKNTPNILFYSRRCGYCSELIKLFQTENILHMFTLINVDETQNIPKNITKVPTLIVAGLPKPLEGAAAFNWFNTKKQFMQTSNNMVSQQKVDLYANPKMNPLLMTAKGNSNNENDVAGIIKREMKNVSDNYTFIKDEDDDKLLKKNALFGKEDQFILTAPEYENKINDTLQTKYLNDLVNKRSQLDSNFSGNTTPLQQPNPRMQQQQIQHQMQQQQMQLQQRMQQQQQMQLQQQRMEQQQMQQQRMQQMMYNQTKYGQRK